MTLFDVLILGVAAGLSAAGLLAMLRSRSRRQVGASALLVLSGPAVALLCTWFFVPAEAAPSPPSRAASEPDLSREEVTDVEVFTDKGRRVKLHRAKTVPDDDHMVAEQCRLLRQSDLAECAVLLSGGWRNCNCHGWVFAAARFFVDEGDVLAILQDNGYARVESPSPSDVAVYRDARGVIVHTGIVRSVKPGQVLVESKWGWGGIFLHLQEVTPYFPAACAFYRAARGGHLLRGLQDARKASDN